MPEQPPSLPVAIPPSTSTPVGDVVTQHECSACTVPITMGSLVLCEIKTCSQKPTRWFHDKDGVHWLFCDEHAALAGQSVTPEMVEEGARAYVQWINPPHSSRTPTDEDRHRVRAVLSAVAERFAPPVAWPDLRTRQHGGTGAGFPEMPLEGPSDPASVSPPAWSGGPTGFAPQPSWMTNPAGSCRDCRGQHASDSDPCSRCGARFPYSQNVGSLAWLLLGQEDARRSPAHPRIDHWTTAFYLDHAGVLGPRQFASAVHRATLREGRWSPACAGAGWVAPLAGDGHIEQVTCPLCLDMPDPNRPSDEPREPRQSRWVPPRMLPCGSYEPHEPHETYVDGLRRDCTGLAPENADLVGRLSRDISKADRTRAF